MQSTKTLLATSVFSTALFTIILPALPVLGANIGLFNNPTYTFTIQANNLITVLTDKGNNVTQFSSLDASVWQQIANENQLIVIPEHENLYANLPTNTQNVVENYVATGGGFISVGVPPDSLDILNGLFNWNIQEKFVGGNSFLNATAAAGTIFAGGPNMLLPIPTIGKADATTLPTGGLNLYATATTSTTLFVAPYQQGRVGFIGLDFTDITSDPNWLTVTNTTVQYVQKSTPEPSNIIALISVGLFGLTLKSRIRS